MIALTQEQRQKRIDWLKQRISSMEECREEIPFGLSEDETMELAAYKDSLASLASPVLGYIHKSIWDSHKQAVCSGDEFGLVAYEGTGNHFAVYATPLVPEIKLGNDITADGAPELVEIANEVKNLELRGAYGAYAAGWNARGWKIKHLNGLGD